MADTSDSEILLGRIREVIRARINGTDSLEKTKDEYKNLVYAYREMEKKFISGDVSGFLKGLLFQHNKKNNTNLTAVFIMRDNEPHLLDFCGDKVLLRAVPELIVREFDALKNDSSVRIQLTEWDEQDFFLVLKKFNVARVSLLLAAVTSSNSFNVEDFNYLSELLALLFKKNGSSASPVVLDYINDMSSEISRIIQSAKGVSFYIDRFMLLNPYEAFSHIGIFPMIDFSEFVVEILRKTYPPDVKIFALSVFKYLVLYDEGTKEVLDVKRNKIDIVFQGNSIPYKVLHKKIETPQTLYLFLEAL